MNKQLILEYNEEFYHWLNNGKILCNCIKWPEPEWFEPYGSNKNIFDDPYYTSNKGWVVVINDEYVEFRKALAEGKTVQYNRNPSPGQKDDWVNMKNVFTTGATLLKPLPECIRIKPDKPEFKVGDFVTEIHSKHANIVLEILGDNIRIRASNMHTYTAPIKDFKHWQPEPGEYCLFWDNNSEIPPILDKFVHYDNTVADVFESQYNCYDNCEPFIGELPIHLKDSQ